MKWGYQHLYNATITLKIGKIGTFIWKKELVKNLWTAHVIIEIKASVIGHKPPES